MLLKGNPCLSIINIRLNYFQYLENTACEGGVLGLSWAGFRAGCSQGGCCPLYLCAVRGFCCACFFLSWAILWSLGETICPAKLRKKKNNSEKTRSGHRMAKQCRNIEEQVPTHYLWTLLRPCLCVFFRLSSQVMLLLRDWKWFFHFVAAKHLVS